MGLGAAMPNAVTLMSEFCPEKRRSFLTNAMFCGFPLGAALGGFLAAWIIPNFGWRAVLLLGGAAPLVLAAVILLSFAGVGALSGGEGAQQGSGAVDTLTHLAGRRDCRNPSS